MPPVLAAVVALEQSVLLALQTVLVALVALA
jgi:hypothetical protein